jgi:hypothetical protein
MTDWLWLLVIILVGYGCWNIGRGIKGLTTSPSDHKLVLNAMTNSQLEKLLAEGNPDMQKCCMCGDPIKSSKDIVGLKNVNKKLLPICNKHSSYAWDKAMRLES